MLPVIYKDPHLENLLFRLRYLEIYLEQLEDEQDVISKQISFLTNNILNHLIDDYINLTKLEINYYSERLKNIKINDDEKSKIKLLLREKNMFYMLLFKRKEGIYCNSTKEITSSEFQYLKTMFRQAIQKCHPDKYHNNNKNHVFSAKAIGYYKNHDIKKMENLIGRIKAGILTSMHIERNNPKYYHQRLNQVLQRIFEDQAVIDKLKKHQLIRDIRYKSVNEIIESEKLKIQENIKYFQLLRELETIND